MKGYIYTLEVLVAASLIFVSLMFVFRSSPLKPQLEISLIKQQGFDALKYIDNEGNLKKYVSEADEKELEDELKDILIKTIKFETEICETECSQRNVPGGQAIIIVDYYVSGYRSSYDYKKVRLYMWKGY